VLLYVEWWHCCRTWVQCWQRWRRRLTLERRNWLTKFTGNGCREPQIKWSNWHRHSSAASRSLSQPRHKVSLTDLLTYLLMLHSYLLNKSERKIQNCKGKPQDKTGHCTVMPLSTYGSLHQSPTSQPDKDSSLPPWTICVFLLSDCLLLDVVLSLSLTLMFGTPFLPMSLQHLLYSLYENV